MGMNARVKNLLTIAGLTDRLLETSDPAAVRALAAAPIDWDSVNARLAAVRAEAEAYLDSHIAVARKSAEMGAVQ